MTQDHDAADADACDPATGEPDDESRSTPVDACFAKVLRGEARPKSLAGAVKQACWGSLSVGIVALATIKIADAATTFLGLTRIEQVREMNPLVAALISEFGLVVGLSLLVVGSVLGITFLIELIAHASSRNRCDRPRFVRTAGFGGASLASLVPVVSNLRILAEYGIVFASTLF